MDIYSHNFTELVVAPGDTLAAADLNGLDLRSAVFKDMDIRSAIFRNAVLVKVDFRGAQLQNADLTGANLANALLSGADLSSANLEGANLRGARLHGANLTGANLRGARVSRQQLATANLTGANLDNIEYRNPDEILLEAKALGVGAESLRQLQLANVEKCDEWQLWRFGSLGNNLVLCGSQTPFNVTGHLSFHGVSYVRLYPWLTDAAFTVEASHDSEDMAIYLTAEEGSYEVVCRDVTYHPGEDYPCPETSTGRLGDVEAVVHINELEGQTLEWWSYTSSHGSLKMVSQIGPENFLHLCFSSVRYIDSLMTMTDVHLRPATDWERQALQTLLPAMVDGTVESKDVLVIESPESKSMIWSGGFELYRSPGLPHAYLKIQS